MLLATGSVLADGPSGQSRSSFVSRPDDPPAGLAAPVLPAQAKDVPKDGPKDVPKDVPKDAPRKDVPIGAKPNQDPYEAYIRLEPPGKERLFGTRETENELVERMRQERRDVGGTDPIVFPEKPELTSEPFQNRKFDPVICLQEPSYVVYGRLYFEDKNSERYGWDLGPIQPFVSSVLFFKDLAMWPHNIATFPHRRFETNAGQCQPGDPVPYYIYPPELTGSGLLAELGVVAVLVYGVP